MRLEDQCSSSSKRGVLLWWLSMTRRVIKHSHLERTIDAAIDFVTFAVRIRIQTFGSTPILFLCFRFFVAFPFIICIRITHKWNLSFRGSLWYIVPHSLTLVTASVLDHSAGQQCPGRSSIIKLGLRFYICVTLALY